MLEKEISDRRALYRRDVAKLVQLVVDAEDAGAKAAQGRTTAAELLQKDAQAMREKLEETGRESVALVDVAAKGSPDEAQKARSELSRQLSTSNRLVNYLDTNIDQQEMLGLDVKADIEYLVAHLQRRADITAGVLQSAKEEIDEIATRAGTDTDADAQKQLASLKKQRDALAESQRVNVRLMDEYGLETARLRQGIIVATGKLSQDIFDKEVASGLVESWFADMYRLVSEQRRVTGLPGSRVRLVLFAFFIAARIGRGLMRRAIDRSKLDVSSLARDFFIKMTGRLILLFGFIIAIAQLGVEVAPLLAGLGIAGFIIGFALQDTLSNFASGMMILVYRPFDVGDVVEAGGVTRQGRQDEPGVDHGADLRQSAAGRAEQADLGRRHSQRHASRHTARRHDLWHWILRRRSQSGESASRDRRQPRQSAERPGARHPAQRARRLLGELHRPTLGENQ